MFFTLKGTLSQSTPQILFLLPKGLHSAIYIKHTNFHNFLKAVFEFEEYFFSSKSAFPWHYLCNSSSVEKSCQDSNLFATFQDKAAKGHITSKKIVQKSKHQQL